MVYVGRAELLESYPDRTIKSLAQEWPMPCVVRFLRKSRHLAAHSPRFTRKNVWLRDHGRCQYCMKPVGLHGFTLDHVQPKSRGGSFGWANIVVACEPCNQKKEARPPEEAGMMLVNHPHIPRVLPFGSDHGHALEHEIPENWRGYLHAL